MFEVKTAGQVLTSSDLESIQYAVDHLGPSFLIIMGHTNCGAAIATVDANKEIKREFPTIVTQIRPAVDEVLFRNPKISHRKLIKRSIVQNIINKRNELEYLFGKRVVVVPALYNISSGKVTWLV